MRFDLAGIKRFISVILLIAAVPALAAIPVRQAGGEKRDRYLDSGVFVGGHDHGPVSLLNVRHSVQPDHKTERFVFDVGQNETSDSAGRPGFFHISIQKAPRRVVVDLENVQQSKISAEQLTKSLQSSPHFSKARFYVDSRYKNLTIEMPLKSAAKIEVFELAGSGKPGRIVMDVTGP